MIPSKVLGVSWDHNDNMASFKTQNLEKFLSNKLRTKRYLLQTVSCHFDPTGFISPHTIKIKSLIQNNKRTSDKKFPNSCLESPINIMFLCFEANYRNES